MARSYSVAGGREAVPFVAPTVRRVLAAEIAAVATGLALLAASVRPVWALLGAVVVALLPFVTVRRKPVFDWCRVCWRFLTNRSPEVGVTTEYTDTNGAPVGVHWHRNTVTCTLEISPPRHSSTVLGRSSADTQYTLPVDALASSMHQHDIEVCSIDVLALGFRSESGSAATQVYEELIGPLPAVALRRVWISVTVDLRANARAIARRGHGRAGAARTAVVATTRVRRALQTHGVSSRLSTSSELHAAVAHLCRGVGISDLTQTWSAAPLPGVSSVGFGIDCSAITAEEIATQWASPSLGTGIAFHLEPGRADGELRVRASCRFAAREPVAKPRIRGVTSMGGSQRDGIFAQLPLAVPSLTSLSPTRTVETAVLDELRLPVSGCGQLLGSDAGGHGVAVRVFGSGVSRVRIAGELYLAQQILFRAIAIGARVVVRTDRPHAWRSLVDAINAPDRLSVHTDATPPRGSFDVILDDFAHGSMPLEPQRGSGVTRMSLAEHEPGSDRSERGRQRQEADLSIVQPHASGDRIQVRSGPIDIELTLVTIPQETAFIGRPRSLRPAVRA